MTADPSLPPFRTLSSTRLSARGEHLVDEIRFRRRPLRRFARPLAAAVVVTAVAAAPALAFSTTLGELVGLQSSSRPVLHVTLTGEITHKSPSRPGTLATIFFTVGERGKQPGTGIAPRSVVYVLLSTKAGRGQQLQLLAAHGTDGRYSVTTPVPPGGIGPVAVGVAEIVPGGSPSYPSSWIPVAVRETVPGK